MCHVRSTEVLISPGHIPSKAWGSYQCEVPSDTPRLVNLNLFEPDDGFGPTTLQESAEVNGAEFSQSVRDQSFEDEFQPLIGGVKRIGHSEEDRVQT